jgi:asparagine synthase (glutamine-hydrolysing)
MCGIAGFYSNFFSKDDLVTMTNRMAHRGPDASGFSYIDCCGLGHRRLSIIDLSNAANQPMTSHSGKHVMVFNGEIYNYLEIAAELQKTNPTLAFKTHSDSEVVLEAFETWGLTFVEKMNGMFAIAIYSIEDRKLYLFRDRMGIKPLFIYRHQDTLAFASELKSITELLKSKNKLSIDRDAIAEFLHLGYIPSPRTIYREIQKFPKASFAVFDGKTFKTETWWNLNNKIGQLSPQNETEAKEELKSLITSAVKYRLISDVPFGTFLSGGTDSSVVTAVAQQVSTEQIKTFSIGFDDAKHNEAPFAKRVAEHLNTNHHEYTLSYRDALQLIPRMQEMYDEPYADSSAVPTFLVSQMARQQVTMTLSGDGGDELFMGYGAYIWANRMNHPLLKMGHNVAAGVLKRGSDKYNRVSDLLSYPKGTFMPSQIFSQEQYFFSWQEVQSLMKSEDLKLDFSLYPSLWNRELSLAEKQSVFDLHYYLPDDLLVKVDRATMQNSLETRVPLLDYRIVEFALNLPETLKMKNGCSKYLLKQVLYDFVPPELFNRPKWGFSIPLDKWMKNELKEYIESYLFIENDYLDSKKVKKLYQRFLAGENHLYQRVWAVFVLNRFLEGI